jgi:hypothetical protein
MSIAIQSNAQSALLSSLDQATAALINPFEYAISKRIKAHGKTTYRVQPTNAGATTAGTTLSFDLPKSGFIRSMTLKFEVECAADATHKLVTPATGFLNAIERVNIESSSRRILTMDRAAIMCAYSDLGKEQREAFERGLVMHGKGNARYSANSAASSASGTSIEVFMPLLLSCCDASNQSLQTGFLEPIRVSITWASSFGFARKREDAADTYADYTITVVKPELIVDSILLPPADEDATISANFGSGPLSSLVYDYESETDTNATMSALNAEGASITKEIKSTACATDIYFWVEDDGSYTSDALLGVNRVPLPVESVSLSASGQTIYDTIPAQFLGCFGRRSLRDGFFGTAASGGYEAKPTGDDDGEAGKSAYVYRLQLGLDNSKQFDSGALSLRELNSPTLTVKMARLSPSGFRRTSPDAVATRAVKMHVVIRKLGLQVVDSSSGRVTSLLSN